MLKFQFKMNESFLFTNYLQIRCQNDNEIFKTNLIYFYIIFKNKSEDLNQKN